MLLSSNLNFWLPLCFPAGKSPTVGHLKASPLQKNNEMEIKKTPMPVALTMILLMLEEKKKIKCFLFKRDHNHPCTTPHGSRTAFNLLWGMPGIHVFRLIFQEDSEASIICTMEIMHALNTHDLIPFLTVSNFHASAVSLEV